MSHIWYVNFTPVGNVGVLFDTAPFIFFGRSKFIISRDGSLREIIQAGNFHVLPLKGFQVEIHPQASTVLYPDNRKDLDRIRRFTQILLSSVHGNRMSGSMDDFPVLVSSRDSSELPSSIEGVQPATSLQHDAACSECGLIRVKGQIGRAFIFSAISKEESAAENSANVEVVAKAFPKRKDFLRPVAGGDAQNVAYTANQSFLIEECTVDRLPAKYALLSAFMPSIMHRIDVTVLVRHLQKTNLAPVGINDPSVVAAAISAPSTGEVADYNRLEFLGDCILKFCAVIHVLTQHPYWPEGYLVLEKDHIVNNNNLAKAAMRAGLDKFILTKAFAGNKWRPVYMSELSNAQNGGCREMSSKVLADVVEALIGAAHVDGGLKKSFTCIQTLLPDEEWASHEKSIRQFIEGIGPCKEINFALVQELVGHNFTNQALLLEAITHVTFPNNRTGLPYERLEFLGDAVLDLIIVPKLFAHPRNLRHWELHRVREVLVNGNFLAFCCMEYAVEEERYDVAATSIHDSQFEVQKSARRVHLHDFLRAGGQVLQSKRRALESFEELRSAIRDDLENSNEYPWPNLIAIQPPKFLSDVVESVLGAIFLDTFGDLTACERFLEKLGIMKYMRRILDENVETAFPKERLGILADREFVEYSVSRIEEADGRKVFRCTVKIGDREVVVVENCGSREEAEARAASEAARILEANIVGGEGAVNQRKRKLGG